MSQEIGEYSLRQCGWICQRCNKFSAAKNPPKKGCLENLNHIYFVGSRILIEIPKDKIKPVKAAINFVLNP